MAKKLQFSSEDSGFIFKTRKPFTRSQISETITIGNMQQKGDKEKMAAVQEVIVISPIDTKVTKENKGQSKRNIQKKSEADFIEGQFKDKEEIVKQRKGKEKAINKIEKELLEEQLKSVREELYETKGEL